MHRSILPSASWLFSRPQQRHNRLCPKLIETIPNRSTPQRRDRIARVVVAASSFSSSVLPIDTAYSPSNQRRRHEPSVSTAARMPPTDAASKKPSPNEARRRSKTSSTHYGVHADAKTYDDAYFYEPGAYMEHLASIVRDRLRLTPRQQHQQHEQPSRCILDIGGGTGTFAEALVRDESIRAQVVVVDPFLGPGGENHGNNDSNNNNGSGNISFVKAPAEDFLVPPTKDSWRTAIVDKHHGGYDQVLLKEVVHHFSEEDRVGIFRGFREGLRSNKNNANDNDNSNSNSHETAVPPSLLIVTRPQTDIDYPLWDEARRVWAKNQPSVETIEGDLRTAGYTAIERSVEAVECSIALSRWQSMVKSRCWSTFSSFTDVELDAACATIAEEARTRRKMIDDADADDKPEQDDPILRFEDRLILLVAS